MLTRWRHAAGLGTLGGALGGFLLLLLVGAAGVAFARVWTTRALLASAARAAVQAEAAAGCWTSGVQARTAAALQTLGLSAVQVTADTPTLTPYGNPVLVGLQAPLALGLPGWHATVPVAVTVDAPSRYVPGVSSPSACAAGPTSLAPAPAPPPQTGTRPFPLRVVVDPTYPTVDWSSNGAAAVAALTGQGYTALPPSAATAWLQTATANGDAPYTQLALVQDPLSAPLAPQDAAGPLLAYLQAGGTVVWAGGDIPAYYQETSSGGVTVWGGCGEQAVLQLPCFSGPYWTAAQASSATPTAAGVAWGLTDWSGSLRPMAPASGLTALATDTVPWTAAGYIPSAAPGWFAPQSAGTFGAAGWGSSVGWPWSNIPATWPDPFAQALWPAYLPSGPAYAEPGTVYFWTTVTVPTPEPVTLVASADDEINAIWVDGQVVPGLTTTQTGWTSLASATLTLAAGVHPVAIEATNLGTLPNPARLLFAAYAEGAAPVPTETSGAATGPLGSRNLTGQAVPYWQGTFGPGPVTVAVDAPPSNDGTGLNVYGLTVHLSDGQTTTLGPSAFQYTGRVVDYQNSADGGSWANIGANGDGGAARVTVTIPAGQTATLTLAIPSGGYWNNEIGTVTASGPVLAESTPASVLTTGYQAPASNVWDAAWAASYPHGGRFVRLWDFGVNWAASPLTAQLPAVLRAIGSAVTPP